MQLKLLGRNMNQTKKYEKIKLGKVAIEVRDIYSPNKDAHLSYIGLEHIGQQTLQLNGVGVSSSTQSSKKIFKASDILFGSLRPYFRKVVKPKFAGVCSTDITVIRSKQNCDQTFLFYFIANKEFIDYATNISYGTKMPRAPWKILKESAWYFPKYDHQQKISSVLSAYDDLIENNIHRIQILEEMAQLIYREWFVNFRFPGYEKAKFVSSDMGKIPDDWEVLRLGEGFDVKYGKNLPIKKVKEIGKYPVYGAGGIIGFYDEAVEHEKVTLITCRGNGSGTVWRTRQAAFITNNSFRIKPKFSFINYFYTELLLKNSDITRALGGSAQPQITIESISYVPVLIPKKEIIEKFVNLIKDLSELIDKLYEKNDNLRRTRDLLLPKLISGEIDVENLDIDTGDIE